MSSSKLDFSFLFVDECFAKLTLNCFWWTQFVWEILLKLFSIFFLVFLTPQKSLLTFQRHLSSKVHCQNTLCTDIKCNKAKFEMIYVQDIVPLKYLSQPWQSSLSTFSHMINLMIDFMFYSAWVWTQGLTHTRRA